MALIESSKTCEEVWTRNQDRQPGHVQLQRIKTPAKIKENLVQKDTPFHISAEDFLTAIPPQSQQCIYYYLEDDCSSYLYPDLKDQISERTVDFIFTLSSEVALFEVNQMTDEEQISLLQKLRSSHYRFSDFENWQILMDELAKNPTIQIFIYQMDKIRRKIADTLLAEGIPLVFIKSSLSVFGRSRHQRSNGWSKLCADGDEVVKFSPIHVSLNDSSYKKTQIAKINSPNCVPEKIFPFREGVISIAPDLTGRQTLLDMYARLDQTEILRIFADAIEGCKDFHDKNGHQNTDIRPYNIFVHYDEHTKHYRGTLLDFECMTPIDDPSIINHHQLYDEGTYYNIRRPRRDADHFALAISIMETYLGSQGMSDFLHVYLPSISPSLGIPSKRAEQKTITRSFLHIYNPEKVVRNMVSWSSDNRYSSHRVVTNDGQEHICLGDKKGNFLLSANDLLHRVTEHFTEHGAAISRFPVGGTGQALNIALFDQHKQPIRTEKLANQERQTLTTLLENCCRDLYDLLDNFTRNATRRPCLNNDDIPFLQQQLQSLLVHKVFPKAQRRIPAVIQGLLIDMLHLDDKKRPSLEDVHTRLTEYLTLCQDQ